MKNLARFVAMIALLAAAVGCEDVFSNSQKERVVFVNKSSYTVHVIPQAHSNWSGFSLDPGEKLKLNQPSDVFFTYEPRYRVDVGQNENGRVLFINHNADTINAEATK